MSIGGLGAGLEEVMVMPRRDVGEWEAVRRSVVGRCVLRSEVVVAEHLFDCGSVSYTHLTLPTKA